MSKNKTLLLLPLCSITLLLIAFVLITTHVQAASIDSGDQQRLANDSVSIDRPVVFEGMRYEPEQFEQAMANELRGVNFVFVPNEYLPNVVSDSEEAIYYLFRTPEDTVQFLEQQGVDFSIYGTDEDDKSPQVPIERPAKNSNSSQLIQPMSVGDPICYGYELVPDTFYDPPGCDLPSVTLNFDVANLSFGSNWNNRISSFYNESKPVLLFKNSSWLGTALYAPAGYIEVTVPAGFDDNIESMDFYPFR